VNVADVACLEEVALAFASLEGVRRFDVSELFSFDSPCGFNNGARRYRGKQLRTDTRSSIRPVYSQ